MMAKHRDQPDLRRRATRVMDPLGFALENFDATGMWRDRDRFAGAPIDSAGELPDGTPIKGPDDLRQALLRHPEQFVQTFTEGLLTYAHRAARCEAYDMPTVRRKIVREARGRRLPVLGARAGGGQERSVHACARARSRRPRRQSRAELSGTWRATMFCHEETHLAAYGAQGRGRHHRAAAARRDDSRRDGVGADRRGHDAEAVRVRRLPARRRDGPLVAAADGRELRRCRGSWSRWSRSAST